MGRRTNLKTWVIIPVLLLLVSSAAALTEWTGSGDGTSWDDGSNWFAGVPEKYTQVDILPPPEQGPIVDVDVECGRIHGLVWTEDGNMVSVSEESGRRTNSSFAIPSLRPARQDFQPSSQKPRQPQCRASLGR